MTALDVANQAFVYTRSAILLKSNNKFSAQKANLNKDYAQRYHNADIALGDLRQWSHEKGQSDHPATLRELVDKVISLGAANCAEYALVAIDYIREKDLWPKEYSGVVSLEYGDHAFVQVGLKKPDGEYYPMNFADWGDAAICDPWANICCEAKHYPQQWKDKMSKWDGRGVAINGSRARNFKDDAKHYKKLSHPAYNWI